MTTRRETPLGLGREVVAAVKNFVQRANAPLLTRIEELEQRVDALDGGRKLPGTPERPSSEHPR